MAPTFKAIVATCALLLSGATAAPAVANVNSAALTVDLDYAIYQGTNNPTTGLNVWQGYLFPNSSQ